MKVLLLCLSIFILSPLYAQKKVTNEKIWTVAYSQSGKVLTEGYLINGIKEGYWREWETLGMPTGLTKWPCFDESHLKDQSPERFNDLIYFTGIYVHGKRNGSWTLIYKQSLPFSGPTYEYSYVINYQNGKKQGEYKKINTEKRLLRDGSYHIDTLMIEEGMYQNDKREGIWKIYSDFGTDRRQKCKATFHEGIGTLYNKDSSAVLLMMDEKINGTIRNGTTFEFNNGLLISQKRFYDLRKHEYIATYSDSTFESKRYGLNGLLMEKVRRWKIDNCDTTEITSYYNNEISAQCILTDDIRIGTSYDSWNGDETTFVFRNSKIDGSDYIEEFLVGSGPFYYSFDQDTTIKGINIESVYARYRYKNHKLDGKCIQYIENSDTLITFEGNYKEGIPDGKWRFYDYVKSYSDDKEIYEISSYTEGVYENGIRAGEWMRYYPDNSLSGSCVYSDTGCNCNYYLKDIYISRGLLKYKHKLVISKFESNRNSNGTFTVKRYFANGKLMSETIYDKTIIQQIDYLNSDNFYDRISKEKIINRGNFVSTFYNESGKITRIINQNLESKTISDRRYNSFGKIKNEFQIPAQNNELECIDY